MAFINIPGRRKERLQGNRKRKKMKKAKELKITN